MVYLLNRDRDIIYLIDKWLIVKHEPYSKIAAQNIQIKCGAKYVYHLLIHDANVNEISDPLSILTLMSMQYNVAYTYIEVQ